MQRTKIIADKIRIHMIEHKEAIINTPPPYLDLGATERVSKSDLQNSLQQVPPNDPLTPVIHILRRYVRLHCPEYLHIGMNELLKNYLDLICQECESILTGHIWPNLTTLLRYALDTNYPFTVSFWNYLSNCTEPVLFYVFDERYFQAVEIILNQMLQMGQLAARAGLRTSKVQHVLRIMELKAEEASQKDLYELARDIRQNMES